MLNTPPTHSIDAAAGVTSVLVPKCDPSWDVDRVDREIKEHYPDDSVQHPVFQYRRGNTRYDLGAKSTVGGETVTVRDYLDDKATELRLRRLKTEDIARVTDWILAAGERVTTQAYEYCCRMGVIDAKNLGFDWLQKSGEAIDETMLQLYDCSGDGATGQGIWLIREIGDAVWSLSQPLTSAEKKA